MLTNGLVYIERNMLIYARMFFKYDDNRLGGNCLHGTHYNNLFIISNEFKQLIRDC